MWKSTPHSWLMSTGKPLRVRRGVKKGRCFSLRMYASHRRPQRVPLGRLLIGVTNAAQERFPEGLADELQAQRQPVPAEAARHRQGRRAIEIIGRREPQAGHAKTSIGHGSVEALWRDGERRRWHSGAGKRIDGLPDGAQ